MSLFARVKRGVKELGFFCLEGMAPLLARRALPDKSNIKKILVFSGGGIGDLIGVLPAIEALHDNFPRASITLLAAPSSSGVLELFPASSIIDELIGYEPRARHRGLGAKLGLIFSLRKKGFDLSYAPGRGQGMREEMLMNYLIGAPVRLGFTQGKAGLLNTCTAEFSGNSPILRQNLEILRAAGLKAEAKGIDLEVPDKALERVYAFLEPLGIGPKTSFIVIHPGAAWNGALRCWPVEKYIELIGVLLKEFGQKIVIIGAKGESAIGEVIFRALPEASSVINAIGETSLLEMAGIINLSSLFIGNDSGPLHLAQAFGVPVAAIFGYTSPAQVIWREEACVAIEPRGAAPRYLHQYDFKQSADSAAVLDLITVEDVMAGVLKAVGDKT